MDDLVSQYFERDLSEAEDGVLSESLFSNDEESLRFAGLAEAAYLRYGLPDPEWPGDPNDLPKPKSGWGNGIWVLSLALILLGLLYGAHRMDLDKTLRVNARNWLSRIQELLSPTKRSGVSGTLDERSKTSVGEESPAPRPEKGSDETLRVNGESSQEVGEVKEPFAGTSPLGRSPMLTPIDMEKDPHRAYSELAAAVHLHAPGEVTVRVQALDGTPVALLFQGPLKQGRWVFDWDGRLPEGEAVAPGHYRVMVESGGVTQAKGIVIRQKKAPPTGSNGN